VKATLFAALGVGAALLLSSAPAHAATPATGSGGQQVSVSITSHLDAKGSRLDVQGSGFDVKKGIYVAFCRVPAAGQLPTPCGGGTAGSTSSAWVSSNPPSYGKGLAQPYGDGGSFAVTLTVINKINDSTDCRKVACAIVTRADHTRSEDRSQDVIVPVSFAATSTSKTPWAIGAVAALAVIGAVAAVVVARRRRVSAS
jgi:hypothetical protein